MATDIIRTMGPLSIGVHIVSNVGVMDGDRHLTDHGSTFNRGPYCI